MSNNKEFFLSPFNSCFEIGMRLLSILVNAYPKSYSIQQLAIFDYMVTHTDDLTNSLEGIHPKTPQRAGELIVRRSQLHNSLILFMTRNLVKQHFKQDGLYYSATEKSASFLDTLKSPYSSRTYDMAKWVIENYGVETEEALNRIMKENIATWGGEFNKHSEILKEWKYE